MTTLRKLPTSNAKANATAVKIAGDWENNSAILFLR
jgi:hypothetical protein